MGQKLLHQSDGHASFAMVPETGAKAVQYHNRCAVAQQICAAQLTAIAQRRDVLLDHFKVEVVSRLGDMVEV